MLKIIKRDSILWPVKVYVPRDDGTGKTDEHVVKIRYKLLTMEEQRDFKSQEMPLFDYVMNNIQGWEEIADENGPLEFNRTNLEMIMDIPYMAWGIMNTFWEAQKKATEKN